MDEQDNYLADFFRVDFFFKNYGLFINSILEKSSTELIEEISNSTNPSHYARIISIEDFFEYEKIYLNQGYKAIRSFRSVIIEKYLKEKYLNSNIVANIKKIKNSKNREIELFLVENSLDKEDVEKENYYLRHFAIEVKEPILKLLEKLLSENEFKNAGGGSNEEEKSNTFYYEKFFGESQLIRLELFRKNDDE